MRRLVALLMLVPASAGAQINNPSSVDQAKLDAIMAAMPAPATAPPLPDAAVAEVGPNAARFALEKHQHPRITQSLVVMTAVGGGFTGTFPAGFFSQPPVINLTWEGSTGLPITCQLLAGTVTTTAFAGKCWSIALTSIVALGSGASVHVVALPR